MRGRAGGAGPRAQRRRLITGPKGGLSLSSRASLQLRLDEDSMTRAELSYSAHVPASVIDVGEPNARLAAVVFGSPGRAFRGRTTPLPPRLRFSGSEMPCAECQSGASRTRWHMVCVVRKEIFPVLGFSPNLCSGGFIQKIVHTGVD